ncbi:type ISP restriction/modification enzyme [Maribacter polysaccharolyticus]|uniref:type ISP restriction/modification enzyme n=1 Tax=Maribacter polysaccharolyticus TaxID=3020831 RepID=UPI00237F1933|nr:type ISP restriction/modification enzyme [Maribacter polysaccharolyticus]MDE3742517.1 hypothetical protein [Maribacter polysaccharolyticus]
MAIQRNSTNVPQRNPLGKLAEPIFQAALELLIERLVYDAGITEEPKQPFYGVLGSNMELKDFSIGFIEAMEIGELAYKGGRKTKKNIPYDQYPKFIDQLAEKLQLTFVAIKDMDCNVCFVNSPEIRDDFRTNFAAVDILDYIHAVWHSPNYREKYKEFLKMDVPLVPYPKEAATFWKLAKLGGEIRRLYVSGVSGVEAYMTSYPKMGSNTITTNTSNKDWEFYDEENRLGRIWINEEQYFDSVPLAAWEFYLGGYQPAQKWLKDRKGRTLEPEDILHYQKIIGVLSEIEGLMKEIDKMDIK